MHNLIVFRFNFQRDTLETQSPRRVQRDSSTHPFGGLARPRGIVLEAVGAELWLEVRRGAGAAGQRLPICVSASSVASDLCDGVISDCVARALVSAAGMLPAGAGGGGYRRLLPLHEVRVEPADFRSERLR